MSSFPLAASSSSSASSSRTLPADTCQSIRAFTAGAYEDDKTSLVEVEAPPTIMAPFLSLSPQYRLVDLIKQLGSSMTSDDEPERARAVVLLSLVVTTLATTQPASKLFDKQAVTTLANFFASKIEDGNVVAASIAQKNNSKTEIVPGSAPEYRRKKYPPGTEMLVASVRALTALARLTTFASEATKVTTESLLAHSSPRVHPQSIRFLIYLLMDTLLAKHRNAIKSMGDRFLKGYIELVEGEKDPRNLVYVFAMDRVILIEWEMDKDMVEAFFDITYCYFPITFRPPPDDPYGISTNTLRLALRKALTASPLLAPHAFPLLIEKLQASGGNAKRDTLETLEEVMPIFGRSAVFAHLKELWEGFRIEIMHATDDATAICSTRALESLLYVLYAGEEKADGVATEMIADMLDEIEEPAKQQAKPAAAILAGMIRATPATSALVTKTALDQMFAMYKEPEDPQIRAAILNHITTLIKGLRSAYEEDVDADASTRQEAAAKEEGRFTFEKPANATVEVASTRNKLHLNGQRSYDGDGRPLDAFRDELLSTLAHGVKTNTTRVAAVELFVNLTHIDFLRYDEIRHLCDNVNDLLVNADAEPVRVQTLEGLQDLGNKRVIEESTLPLLFGLLPDRIDSSHDPELVRGQIRRSLGALARLCDSTEFFNLLVIKLMTKFDLTCAAKSDKEANIGYARGLINTITVVYEEKIKRKDRDISRYGALIPHLIGNCIETTLRTGQEISIASDQKLLRDVGVLVTLLTRSLEQAKQREVSSGLMNVMSHGKLDYLSTKSALLRRLQSSNPAAVQLDLFDQKASVTQRNALYVVASAIIAVKKEASEVSADVTVELSRLLQWILASRSLLQEQAGSALIANTINKYLQEPVGADFETLLQSLWGEEITCHDSMQVDSDGSSSRTMQRRCRAVRVWLVMARALLVRNSPTGQSMMSKVLSLFDSSITVGQQSTAREAARVLGRVTCDDDVLCKENGSTIRLLYKQRFVTFLLPQLLQGFDRARQENKVAAESDRDSMSDTQSIHLIAICSLLPSLPKATLLDRLTDLFPVLIMALDLQDDETVKKSAINVISLATAVGKREKDEASTKAMLNGGVSSDDTVSAQKNTLNLVQNHLSAIIKRLMSILVSAAVNSEQAKIAALRCLTVISKSMEYHTLHPHKAAVLKVLGQKGAGVDDAKRIVRVDAVETRDAWYALKLGEGEEE